MEVLKIARSADWWEYKIPPLLAIAYATVLFSNKSIAEVAPSLLLLLAALMVGAIYVSIINDITDLEEDEASGKSNRIAKISPKYRWMLPFVCVLAGLGFTYLFIDNRLTVFLYLMAWISFSLYSIPPVRLKKRAGWGLIADASGAHFFTSLFMVAGTSYYTSQEINWIWFSSVGLWSLTYGLRGILWHQFADRENDLASGTTTFATQVDPNNFRKFSVVLIAIELTAFFMMLVSYYHILLFISLIIYFIMVFDRKRKFGMQIVLVISPAGRPFQILMGEYYQIFYPLILLIIGVFLHPNTLIVLFVHLLLFPKNIWNVTHNIGELIRQEIFVRR